MAIDPASLQQLSPASRLLVGRLEAVLPIPSPAPDWQASTAFSPIASAAAPASSSRCVTVASDPARPAGRVEAQKERLLRNTEQFVAGRARQTSLTGSRGTKSFAHQGLPHEFAPRGLRLIEVDRPTSSTLPDIVDLVAGAPERFVVFCDD